MTNHRLNWKDHMPSYSVAHASRAVGGKYRITFYPSEPFSTGGYSLDSYRIDYCIHYGRGAWNDTPLPHSTLKSWAEAKACAEADHARRLAEKS